MSSTTGTQTVQPGRSRPIRLFVYSHPRTASNLFFKIFSAHPQLSQSEYPFLRAYMHGPDAQARLPDGDENVQRAHAWMREKQKHATYQYVLDKLEEDVADAELEGKIPMFKEHAAYMTQAIIVNSMISQPRHLPPKPAMVDNFFDVPLKDREHTRSTYNKDNQFHNSPNGDAKPNDTLINPLVIPDRLVNSFTPVFIIRHPAKQVGSFYKATRMTQMPIVYPEFEIGSSYKFSRLLFDYYKALSGGNTPLVLDGDDLINDTERITKKFCEVLSLDPSGVIYEWGKSTAGDPFEAVFKGTLNASNGVVKNPTPETPNIAKEALRWEKDWGMDVAKALVKCAEDAMADYEYLYQFRL